MSMLSEPEGSGHSSYKTQLSGTGIYRYVFNGIGGFILIMNQSETRFFVWKEKGLAMIFREMLDEVAAQTYSSSGIQFL